MFDTLPCSLSELRHRLGVTQKRMAAEMGISTKNLAELEQGWFPIRPIHIKAALFAATALAAEQKRNNYTLRQLQLRVAASCREPEIKVKWDKPAPQYIEAELEWPELQVQNPRDDQEKG